VLTLYNGKVTRGRVFRDLFVIFLAGVVSHSSCQILTDLSSRLIPVVGFSLQLSGERRAA